ncbi:unnamed protein product [Amaranthus hypochondriacus]
MNENKTQQKNDRITDLKAFDEAKTGVKGLVDAGIKQLPSIFIRPPEDRSKDLDTWPENISVPVIDFSDLGKNNDETMKIVARVCSAAKNWGFFQVVNHGIPLEIMEKMIEKGRMFHEQDDEAKKKWYNRDPGSNKVTYVSNHDLYKSNAANWRDSLNISTLFADGHIHPDELPDICKDVTMDYINHMKELGEQTLKLLSMGLGLKPEVLGGMESSKGWSLICHYYPACPEPELTLGCSGHADISFITILLQDQIGGLQIVHDNKWVDVQPIPNAFIVNIGDSLQIASNGLFKSAYHRAISKSIGPRISIAFFFTGLVSQRKKYGPIKELISQENPAIYRDFTLEEFLTYFYSKPLDQLGIDHFKLPQS